LFDWGEDFLRSRVNSLHCRHFSSFKTHSGRNTVPRGHRKFPSKVEMGQTKRASPGHVYGKVSHPPSGAFVRGIERTFEDVPGAAHIGL